MQSYKLNDLQADCYKHSKKELWSTYLQTQMYFWPIDCVNSQIQ